MIRRDIPVLLVLVCLLSLIVSSYARPKSIIRLHEDDTEASVPSFIPHRNQPPSTTPTAVISIDTGMIQGVYNSVTNVNGYYGIPFALPPVGSLRFTYPQRPLSWSGVQQTTAYSNMCVQSDDNGGVEGNEDCLYLNVFVHANLSTASPAAVMVFFYGGSYIHGDAHGNGLYDGNNYVSNNPNVIIVTSNYRLGPLGFIALEELKSESNANRTGNYAIADQVAVLEWVQRNIASFGGNPNQVTIFGESAGAFSVSTHLVSPLSAGLFHGAIMESGAGLVAEYFMPESIIEANSNKLASNQGCGGLTGRQLLQCLRNVDAGQLMLGSPNIAAVSIDNHVLTAQPVYMVEQNTWNPVPVILGSNKNESGKFLANLAEELHAKNSSTSIPLAWQDLPQAIAQSLQMSLPAMQPIVNMILETYSQSDFDSAQSYVAQVWEDEVFRCPAQRLALAIAANGSTSAFVYNFAYNASDYSGYQQYGDFHGLELPYVFDTLIIFDHIDWTMMNAIQNFWSAFAMYGNPNQNLPPAPFSWPSYTSVTDTNIMELAIPLSLQSDLHPERCKVWNSIWQLERDMGCTWC